MTVAVGGADDSSSYLPIVVKGAAAVEEQSGHTVTVLPGDHLWSISKSVLEERLGREPTTSEVTPYWRKVIIDNIAGLESGDPDLIYPGEVIAIP